MDDLLEEVRTFAERKIIQLERKTEGFANVGTPDDFTDWTQEAVIAIWQALVHRRIRGETPGDFYAYLNRLVFNHKQDFKKSLIKAKKTRVSFLVKVENEHGDIEEIENPEVFNGAHSGELSFRIPEFVQGVDRLICSFIVEGFNYRKIANILGLTEDAIKGRMKRIREKTAKEAQEKLARIKARDVEYKAYINRGGKK